MKLLKIYLWNLIWVYHFYLHQKQILEEIDNSPVYKTSNHKLKQYMFVLKHSCTITNSKNKKATTRSGALTRDFFH